MKNILLFILFLSLFQCSPKQPFYNYEVSALHGAKNADGTIFLRSSGFGKRSSQARKQALKNCVRAVIFKGIPNSSVKRPLVNNPGAEQSHRDYFDAFFSDDGKYLQFIVETSLDRVKRVSGGKVAIVNTKVFYTQLQKELENARIIRKFGI